MTTPARPLSRRKFIQSAATLAAGVAAPALLRVRAAHAAYPERPIKVVVANTPGGPSDIVGRIVTGALQQSTGKTFIVENRGGAGGNIGMGFAAHAEPDGYTILLATNAYSINYGLYRQLPYDPYKSFVAVAHFTTIPMIIVVPADGPKTLQELIALLKKEPGKSYGTPGNGTLIHMGSLLFSQRIGANTCV